MKTSKLDDNDHGLWRFISTNKTAFELFLKPILIALGHNHKNRAYNTKSALKLYKEVADCGARMYTEAFGSTFDEDCKIKIADTLESKYYDIFESGKYFYHIN